MSASERAGKWEVAHPTNTPTQLALPSDHVLMRGANAYPELPAERVHTGTGERAPITEAWRAMSKDEYAQAQERGFIKSDERSNLFPGHEGTNASPERSVAAGYVKHSRDLKDNGVLVKLHVHPDEQWFASTDGNLRTRQPIPMSRVVSVTQFGDL